MFQKIKFIFNKELIPKPILSQIDKKFITIFHNQKLIDYSEFEIKRNSFEFWDRLTQRIYF